MPEMSMPCPSDSLRDLLETIARFLTVLAFAGAVLTLWAEQRRGKK